MNENNAERSNGRSITFEVIGIPRPGGSKNAIITSRGKVAVFDSCKYNRQWRDSVAAAAIEAKERLGFVGLMTGPVGIIINFKLPRPKSHFRTGKYAEQVRPGAPKYPITKPDYLKLTRSTEDALTGILWVDDAQICEAEHTKDYAMEAENIGATIRVYELEGWTDE